MSLLDRFLGGRERVHAEGIALLEEGRFAEAVICLREAVVGRTNTSGSLASYHFRQALLAEGRRLLRAGSPDRARDLFDEAVGLWDRYPDLHCLAGTAAGLSADWDAALAAARTALRLNPDYVEARLLESTSLQALERPREAAEALDALLESGRRVQSWLVERLARPGGYGPDSLPANLPALLTAALGGESEKEEVAAAVALCRAGRWEEGLARFGELVTRRPRYPDYRTRHAAALFQLDRDDEALTEVEAALALNEDYRLAIDLKALILADSGRIAVARAFLQSTDQRRAQGDGSRNHEDLFGAYLRGVLALLTGHPGEVVNLFDGWRDLAQGFSRAELLVAAAEDLTAAPAACRARLETLAREWSAEPVYSWLLACHQLAGQRYEELASVLSHWPARGRDADWRPLYLEGHLAVCQGRTPALPDGTPPVGTENDDGLPPVGPDAWTYLAARVAFLRGEDEACLESCTKLAERGSRTERLGRLELTAAASLEGADKRAAWSGNPLPDSCLPGRIQQEWRCGGDDALRLLADQARLHPEDPCACWLSPGFWLTPVRAWIA